MKEKRLYIYIIGRTKIPAIVVACVKDVGITIVAKENKEQILYCLRMKNAPNFPKKKGNITSTRKSFTLARKQIISGMFYVNKLYSSNFVHFSISPSACAFNQ